MDMRDEYGPHIGAIALFLFKLHRGKSLKWAFKIADKYLDIIDHALPINYIMRIPVKYIEKEFLFRGFVKDTDIRLHNKYGYFRTNIRFGIDHSRFYYGYTLVYPKKYAHDFRTLTAQPDIPYFNKYMGKIGIPGYTQFHPLSRDRKESRRKSRRR